jgi:signal transduction histidine kinase
VQLADIWAQGVVDPRPSATTRAAAGTREALETLRDLARGIYPPLLAEQGLAPAVSAHAGKVPLPIIVDAAGVRRYPADIETAVYFCCVEAVQNAARHAPQSTVRIRLRGSAEDVSFEIADDGPGFDQSRVQSSADGGGCSAWPTGWPRSAGRSKSTPAPAPAPPSPAASR